MKNIQDFINENNDGFKDLNPILKKTGWPSLQFKNGKAMSIDEDTIIEFDLDDWDNKPFISKITCKFVTGDPAHLRDLNSLVELFQEINKL